MDNIREAEPNLIPSLSSPALRVVRSIGLFVDRYGDRLETGMPPDHTVTLDDYRRTCSQLEGEMITAGVSSLHRNKASKLLQDVIAHVNLDGRILLRTDPDSRELATRVYYGLRQMVDFLDNPEGHEIIIIGQARLTKRDIEKLLEGISGFGGKTTIEESEKSLKAHLEEDNKLFSALGTTPFKIGGILYEAIQAVGPSLERVLAPKTSTEIRGRKYTIEQRSTILPGGLPFQYLEDERLGTWDFYDLGDFTVKGDHGTYEFAGNCAKACRYNGYIEPKTVSDSDLYRIDPGEVLEFFGVLPNGMTWEQMRNIRLQFYAKDLASSDGRIRWYAASKLFNIVDEKPIDMIVEAFRNPVVETQDDLLSLLKVMNRLSMIKDLGLRTKIVEFFQNLDLSRIGDPEEKRDFEKKRVECINGLAENS